MNKKSVIALVLTLSLLFISGLTACAKKADTLENFLQSNEDVKKEIQDAADASGLSVEIKGNEVTYSFDLSTIQGADEKTLKDPAMIEKLEESIDNQGSTFVDLCKSLEEKTGFTGIKMIVNYTYKDEVLISRTYTSEG